MSKPERPADSAIPTRRSFLSAAAGAALAATFPSNAQSNRAPAVASGKRRLNVLFFMSDDMRVELGCYGSRFHPHTPNIDKLASQGVRFDRNYCQFPLCNPSRASLFSGRPPHTTCVLGNRDKLTDLNPDYITFPHLFRNNGYITLRAGKLFHAGMDDPKAWSDPCCDAESLHPTGKSTRVDTDWVSVPKPDGTPSPLPKDDSKADHSDQLLVLDADGEHSGDDEVTRLAIRYMRKNKDKPFLIGCGFSKPHSPPAAPKSCWDLYDPAKLTLPPNFAPWPTVPEGFPRASIRPKNADLFIGRGATPEEAQQTIQAYLASISWVDHNLGRVLAELDSLGLRDNTVVVFVADHGYQLGERGKWSKAGSLFEPACRVPLIIHAPGAAGNGRPCLRITQSLNLYRTLAELAGLEVPHEIEGESMVSLLHNPSAPWDKPAYSVWSEDGKTIHGTVLRTEQWRYAEFGKGGAHGVMMFDAHADPMELHNVADDPKNAGTRSQFSKLIADYTASGKAADEAADPYSPQKTAAALADHQQT